MHGDAFHKAAGPAVCIEKSTKLGTELAVGRIPIDEFAAFFGTKFEHLAEYRF